jgi:hypothetical protein
MMGGAVGGIAHTLFPDYTGSVGAYALVGMGAAFAGIVRVPLTSVIMVFEITRDYSIIVPLMIANLISYFIASRLQDEPIYEALQHQDGIRLPSGNRARRIFLRSDMRMKQNRHRWQLLNESVRRWRRWTANAGLGPWWTRVVFAAWSQSRNSIRLCKRVEGTPHSLNSFPAWNQKVP